MFWVFKGIGMILIMTVSVVFGFYLSAELIRKNEKLRLIYRSLDCLAQRVRISNMNASKLLKTCFSDEVLYFEEHKFFINKTNLSNEDICLLEEFLSGFGKGDTHSEYTRAVGYADLFENRYKEMKEKNGPLCSLYRKLGTLLGLFICVFLV